MTPWALVGAMLAVGCAAEPELPAFDADVAGGTGVAAASADQMPTEFDTKKISHDPTTDRVVLWMTNMRTARVTRIEPLD